MNIEKLRRPVYRKFEDGLKQPSEDAWENVNIAMKTSLLKRLDNLVESDLTSAQSRSKLVREIIREKLHMLEEDF